MGTNSLTIKTFKSPAEAPQWNLMESPPTYAELNELIVVENGTEGGKATVDLVFVDPATGKKFVALITAKLLKTALAHV